MQNKILFPIFIVLLLLLCACFSDTKNDGEKSYAKKPGDTCISTGLHDKNGTTGYLCDPVRPAAPYRLDSLIIIDSAYGQVNRKYFIRLPKSGSIGMGFAPVGHLDPGDKSPYLMECWPYEFAISGNLVSVLTAEQTKVEGASHYDHSLSTQCYDLKKEKFVSFPDIFNVKAGKERKKLLDKINAAYPAQSSEDTPLNLDTNVISANADFFIGCGELTIYPGELTFVSYTHSGFGISLEKIKEFIRPEYAWLVN